MRTLRLRLSSTAVIALLAAGLAPAARAQNLVELYEQARAYDATFLAAQQQMASTEHRIAQIEALARPNAALLGDANATRLDEPLVGHGELNTLSATLQGRYALFNRGNDVTIEQARRSFAAAQATLESAEQDLIVRLAQAYFDVLAAKDSLATAETSKKAIAEQLASAKRNFEVGTATITDTREAQARYDLALAQEIAAQNELRTRRIVLDQLVGRANVEPKGLVTPVTLPATVPDSPDPWVALGEQQHPAIRNASINLQLAELETDKARAARLPTVDAVASVGAARNVGNAVQFPGNGTSGSIGLQLTLPLYTGGATEARIRETLRLADKARDDLDAAKRGVAQNTRTAFYAVESGRAQAKALEAAEASSQLALEATQLGYKVGVRVNIDVLNAQTQLYQTQRDLSRARYDVLVGGLRLRLAAGTLAAGDLAAVNRLLAK